MGCSVGCGVVFKLSPGGSYTVLHSFNGSDGAIPYAGLIADSKGNLYGIPESPPCLHPRDSIYGGKSPDDRLHTQIS